MSFVNFESDALRVYQRAVERRDLIAGEWEKLDRPITTPGSRGQVRPHPLIAMLNDADALCERLRKPIRVRHRGPVSFLERTALSVAPDVENPRLPPPITLRRHRAHGKGEG